jgi:phosphomannomutase
MKAIRFGTEGWRAVIADEFTLANVRLVAQAIARYVTGAAVPPKTGGESGGLVIGFDNRFQSESFAAAVAEVVAGNGIPAWLTAGATPTPVTAHAVRELKAAGAVMVTAGHHPLGYNGIRFIPEYAGAATPEIAGAVEAHLSALAAADVKLLPLAAALEQGLVRRFDPKPAYLEHLLGIVKYSAVSRGQLRVVIDPMWGAGTGYLEEFLREGCGSVKVVHGCRGVLNGGRLPDPSGTGLADLQQAVVREQADLGLALDGDAGRFGVIDRDGSSLSPNEVICLLLHYLTEYRNWRGAVARTVATTHMIDRIAEDFGLPVVETPVGFRHVGQSLIRHRSILGGDESGGLSVQGHVPEQDGILALAMVVEMVSSRKKPLRAYQEEVQEKYGRLVSERLDLPVDPGRKRDSLERLQQWVPVGLNGKSVLERNAGDGVKLVLEDGSWVLIRPDDDGPLFRIYAEAPDLERLDKLQGSARQVLGV